MKILIDIGHPAHVHYFRNFIKLMQKRKHNILVVARDKEVSQELLKKYNIPYITRGKGRDGLVGKVLYMLKADLSILIKSLSFRPDIFLSFGSPYPAQVSWILRKPHIAFADTEHAKLTNYAFMPFSSDIVTPKVFEVDLGQKHIKFDGFMEYCYLHKNYFEPTPNISDILDIQKGEKYIILRFVSWGAVHDIGHSGLDDNAKAEIVEKLSKYHRVFISSEGKLPEKFSKYKINISPDRMHDVLANATLFLGEGATMASECAMLGTPAIYVNSLNAGTLMAQERSGSIFGFRDSIGVLKKAIELLEMPDLEDRFQKSRKALLKSAIDVTAFMVWFVENYPKSRDIIKKEPNYQYRFKS
jgi:predicted glycosyltransferase